MPDSVRDVRSLIAVATAALYRAKGAGMKRSAQAVASEEPSWAGRAGRTGGAANIASTRP
jgi:hypothetical protein